MSNSKQHDSEERNVHALRWKPSQLVHIAMRCPTGGDAFGCMIGHSTAVEIGPWGAAAGCIAGSGDSTPSPWQIGLVNSTLLNWGVALLRMS